MGADPEPPPALPAADAPPPIGALLLRGAGACSAMEA